MEPVFFLILVPFIFGVFCCAQPPRVKGVSEASALIGSLVPFGYAIYRFILPEDVASEYFLIDQLSSFILLATGFFGFIIVIYSLSFMSSHPGKSPFYGYCLLTISAACGVLMANHLILLLIFWGFLGMTLYLLIGMGGAAASDASKKTFIIVGGSDGLMILGIAIIWVLTNGVWRMDHITINLARDGSFLPVFAFLCLVIASFAKAGAMPFHTWIPDCTARAPVPATALLPASLDKLLGIYLLARVALHLFVMNGAMQLILLIVGAATIVAAVFMALAQHDFKRLLGYHAVSQVGYMILGIATCNPVGIAGGLFHMLNNAIYKSCLFLCGGAVEKRTGTTDLDKLGGLAKLMPLTFFSCLVAALAISGVPPLNGFMSKWMVYQGVIELGRGGNKLWIVWLVAAMFGSGLTLASFMKLIHATFLGQPRENLEGKKIREVPWTMWMPMVSLALLCLVFGIFAASTALPMFILPAVKGVMYLGFWEPVLATLFILIGLFIGGIVYFLGRPTAVRESQIFVGGEILEKGHEVSGVDFYRTVQDMGIFKYIYKRASEKLFDIYELGKGLVFGISKQLQNLHTGILPFYLIWCLLGMAILLIVFGIGGQ